MTVNVKDVTGILIPLRSILKKFLELPNVFSIIEKYMNDCSTEKNITSFLNAQLWLKTKAKYSEKFVIPIMLLSMIWS